MLETTIKYPQQISGIGLHSGQNVNLNILPAPEKHGVVFKKKTKKGDIFIPASHESARESELCTTLVSGGHEIQTVEHLLSAINAMDIDNLLIEINGDEVPIFDGSANYYIDVFKKSESVTLNSKRQYIQILSPISFENDKTESSLLPSNSSLFTCSIDYEGCPLIGKQQMTFDLSTNAFIEDISYARTFGFYEDYDRLKSKGRAQGASLANTVVIDGQGNVMNENGLRDKQEFVRHKILDAIGDIKLAGKRIIGHFKGIRPGHRATYLLLRLLFNHPECWRLVTV